MPTIPPSVHPPDETGPDPVQVCPDLRDFGFGGQAP